MPESNPKECRDYFSRSYLEVAQTDLIKNYQAVQGEQLKPLPISDVVGYEVALFGLFRDQQYTIRRSIIETERHLSSKTQVMQRAIELLADTLDTYLDMPNEEERVFKDWRFSRDLMIEAAASEKQLRFIGGLAVYQLEPRTPLKTGVIYPEVFTEWVFHEQERIALDIKNFELKHSDITRLERDVLTAKPAAIAGVCGKAVLSGLSEGIVEEVKTI